MSSMFYSVQAPDKSATGGFTIVEMLVTIVIVSILASAALPMAELAHRRSKEQELRRDLLLIREALDAYKKAADEGRVRINPGESGYPATLPILVEGVDDIKSPTGGKLYFLRRIPRDPLNPDGSLPPAETWGTRSYASSAEDPQPGADVYDIYSLAPGTGLDGTEYRQW